MTDLGGKTVLITGAASGIGRLMAFGFAHRGATVVGWDLEREPLDVLVKELHNDGGIAYAYVCDVGDRAAVLSTADRVHREVGPVDVLVNNAGVVSGKYFLDLSEEDIERTFRVNTLAHFWTIQALLPQMVERGSGHIVTIASSVGLAAGARVTDYAASKAAAVGLTESLRLELADLAPGVRTTLVCPNIMDTPLFAGAEMRLRRLIPVLHAEDVATAVVRAVERNRERLYVPWLTYPAAALRALPAPVADAVLRVLGASSGMDHFVGRQGDR